MRLETLRNLLLRLLNKVHKQKTPITTNLQIRYPLHDMNFNAVYFLGAGGIGMSALERYFRQQGLFVAGYDRTPSTLTQALQEEGIDIHFEDNPELIPAECRNPQQTLVIYTPAIPADHQEMAWFRENGFELHKRAQVLGTLTQSMKGLCVAGTHGKTSTSAMTAHLLHQSQVGCNAAHYTSLIQPGGALVVHRGLRFEERLQPGVRRFDYGRTEGDFHAEHIRIGGGRIVFDLVSPLGNISDIELGVPVSINIDNGIAACALAQLAGVTAEEIRTAMLTFGGVDRRFDFKIKNDRCVFLSDYAHHPAEIKQSILSLREVFDGRKISAIFQPHLYTRTRDFYTDFADALSLLDEVILLDIYPARELPIEGVTSQLIYDRLRPDMTKRMAHLSELPQLVSEGDFDVLVVLGAGDADTYCPQLTDILQNKLQA